MKLYPAIDLIEGRCVRLYQGRFDMKTEYSENPVEVAKGFATSGAKFLHVVDLDGAREGARRQSTIVARLVAESGLQVQTGGGIRTMDDAKSLLDLGVERIVIGSLAVKDPKTTRAIIDEFGAKRVTLGLDVRLDDNSVPRVATHGWVATETQSLWEVLDLFTNDKDVQLLCTDISTDGTLTGPNFLLYAEVLKKYPDVKLLASGGIGSLDDIRRLAKLGVTGAVVGKALYEGRFTLEEALAC